ncbi:MAG: hypothetical protein K2X81_10985, partial [Candidatus Obscuribacterales bacterium]|nr:hypothetical protein [Candidatus Obscuribacterales bacterium]
SCRHSASNNSRNVRPLKSGAVTGISGCRPSRQTARDFTVEVLVIPMARKKIPQATETDILTKSRRRCCFCYGLNQDEEAKKGQVAHLDQDNTNFTEDNLAFLCFNHHDEYDSKTRQSKNLTMPEAKRYRSELYKALSAKTDTVTQIEVICIHIEYGKGLSCPTDALNLATSIIYATQRKIEVKFEIYMDKIIELKKFIETIDTSDPAKRQEAIELNSWIIDKTSKLDLIVKGLNILLEDEFFEYFYLESNEFADVLLGLPEAAGLGEEHSRKQLTKLDVWMKHKGSSVGTVIRITDEECAEIVRVNEIPSIYSFGGPPHWDFHHLPPALRHRKAFPAMLVQLARHKTNDANFDCSIYLDPARWLVGLA